MFGGSHPNNINPGHTAKGLVLNPPIVGQSCEVGTLWTSTVTSILERSGNMVRFTTLNSTYELTYDE